MGGTGGSSAHLKNNKGLPNTLCSQTTSYKHQRSGSLLKTYIYCTDNRDSSDETTTDTGSSPKQLGVSVSLVPSSENGRISQANTEPQGTERISRTHKISAHKFADCPSFPATSRLDDEAGPSSSLLSRPRIRESSSLSQIGPAKRPSTSDDVSSIWASKRTKDLRNIVKLDSSETQRKKHKSTRLSRRLSLGRSVSSDSSDTSRYSDQPALRTRLDNKQRKVVSNSNSSDRILGYPLGHSFQPEITSGTKDKSHAPEDIINDHEPNLDSSRPTKNCRNSELRQLHRPLWQTKFSTPSRLSQHREEVIGTSMPFALSVGRSQMVEESSACPQQNLVCSNLELHRDRRLGDWMGSLCERTAHPRHLVRRREAATRKHEGTAGNPPSSSGSHFQPEHEKRVDPHTKRQQNCSGLSSEPRGNPISEFDDVNQIDLPSDNERQHSHSHQLHTRSSERHCRQSIPREISGRVASFTSSLSDNLQQMGSPQSRLICISSCSRSSRVRDPGCSGPTSDISRCLQQTLGLQTSLAIPPALSDEQGPGIAKSSTRDFHRDMPEMEQCILEGGPQETSPSTTVHSAEPRNSPDRYENGPSSSSGRKPGVGGLEMSGWDELLKDWSPSQRELIVSSWRPSTLKTYKQAWSRWLEWCRGSNVDVKNPGGDGLSKYLIYLYETVGLSYRTILVHKSVVSSFCHPELETKIGSHVLVRHTLRGIANKSAHKTRVLKPPIWNPQTVVDWLLESESPLDSLFEVSRRCAIILLLASGRRVHDLTLLSTSEDSLIRTDNNIVLWPRYGSKTDSINHRQSGWKLISASNKRIDPVFWINKLLEVSLERRSSVGGIDNLFITTRGTPKAASRTIIGGWIKTVLNDAGINDSPGSIRSAVASLNWVERFPIEDILARGNWLHPNTLLNYYRRPLEQPLNRNTPLLALNFEPIT